MFAIGDILRVKAYNRAADAVVDNWLEVTGTNDPGVTFDYYEYSVSLQSGAAGTLVEGAAVIGFGQSGDGLLEISGDDSEGPFIRCFTHAGAPWTTISEHARIGNLNGILSLGSDEWGLAAGDDLDDDTVPHLIVSDQRTRFQVFDDSWIGLGVSAGRLVFDITPTPDQIAVTDADLYIATTGHGFIHIDNNTAGYVFVADGTRYIPANAATTLPISPVAQGDILIADAVPAWSILSIGAQYTHLESSGVTATWEANITLADDAYVGLGAAAGRLTFDSSSTPDTVTVVDATAHVQATQNALTALETPTNYHAVLYNPANDTGEGVGLGFYVSAEANDVGAAIVFVRTGGHSQGELRFYTKQDANDASPPVQTVTLSDAGDLVLNATGQGLIHVDGNTAGYVLRADGTRYVPANPTTTLPLAPVAQGDMIVADGTPAWSILTLGAAAGYALVSTATTAVWDQTPTWTGLHTFTATPAIEIDVASGDPVIVFDTAGANRFVLGVDDSDSDKLKINSGSTLADPSDFEIDSSGNVEAAGNVTLGGSVIALGDTNTYLSFPAADQLSLYAGGIHMVQVVEGGTDYVNFPAGLVFVNETSNAYMKQGITIDQGANDDEIFNVRSSDVGAVYSAAVETGTYGTLSKASALAGGLEIWGLRDADASADQALALRGFLAENLNTTKTTAGIGAVDITGYQTSGVGVVNTVADGNVLSVRTYRGGGTVAVVLVDEDGDVHIDGGLVSLGDSNTYLAFPAADQLALYAGGVEFVKLVEAAQDELVVNDGGADIDTRMEASGAADAFFLQGSSGYIGYGTNTPDTDAHWVSAVSGDPALRIENTNADAVAPRIQFVKHSASPADDDAVGLIDFRGATDVTGEVRYAYIAGYAEDVTYADSAGSLIFNVRIDDTVRQLLALSGYNGIMPGQGQIVFNESGLDIDTRIEASGAPNALVVQGSNGYVGMGIGAPTAQGHLYHATNDVLLRIETDKTNGEAQIQFVNDAISWNVGINTTDELEIIDNLAPGVRLTIDASGHILPGGNKTQNLGATGTRWNTLYQGTSTAAGTSRLFESTRDCPLCQARMVRGTGSLCILGEDRDYELAHCPNCGNVAVEELAHLSTELLPSRRPPPKIEFLGLEVFAMSGNSRKVQVKFRYVDGVDGHGEVINSTFLGETELAALMAMTKDEQRTFLADLGQREWDALEEVRLQQCEVVALQDRLERLTDNLVGVDLLV